MKHMGRGDTSPYKVLLENSGDIFTTTIALSQKLHNQSLKMDTQTPYVRYLLTMGARINKAVGELCRPIGHIRYVTGILPELTLDTFKEEFPRVEEIFHSLLELAKMWNALATEATAGHLRAPANTKQLTDHATETENAIDALIKTVKEKMAIDQKIHSCFLEWDECLAINLHSKESSWTALRELSTQMKRDKFSDIDHWKNQMTKWRLSLPQRLKADEKKKLTHAAQVLENYCRLKHIQKALTLW